MNNKIKNKYSNTGLIVPAAGNSERMKSLKPFLKFDDEHCFIEQIIESYLSCGITKISVVINPEHEQWHSIRHKYKNVQFVENHHIEYGRMYSTVLGMKSICGVENCFMQNIDNPFVNSKTIKKIINLIKNNSFIVPCYKKRGGHPILLAHSIINHICKIDDYSLNLRDVLSIFNRINLESDDSDILININTEEDYKKYIKS